MRTPMSQSTQSTNGTYRATLIFFVAGLLCSISAIGIGIFGTTNVAEWAIPTLEARWTARAEERSRVTATAVRQTVVAVQRESTETARPSTDRTATSTAIPMGIDPPADWRLVFSETFPPNTTRWPLFDERDYYTTHKTEVSEGVYRWETLAHRDFVWWAYPDSPQLSDFHLSVEARRLSGTLTGEFGVVMRIQDGDYYRFAISDVQTYSIERYSSDRWRTFSSSRLSTEIKPQEFNRLTVASSGSHFYFFINGQLVDEIEDDELGQGYIGLTIGLREAGDEAVFEFDNFSIYAPDP
jgi:hypothetical protein